MDSEFVERVGRLPVPEAATLSLQVGTNLGGTSVGCTPCAIVVKDYPQTA
jgi:hypothetical protein